MISGVAVVLGTLLPSVRVMLRDDEGVPFARDEPEPESRSIGVDDMIRRQI